MGEYIYEADPDFTIYRDKKYAIYGMNIHTAAKLAASMDLHILQWKYYDLYTERTFAQEVQVFPIN